MRADPNGRRTPPVARTGASPPEGGRIPRSRRVGSHGMQRLNILFSTSRQWNCGDEFILFGVRRLLDRVPLRYNSIIYNRHPGEIGRAHV